MSKMSVADIAKEMAGIDIAILSTHTENGEIANRPMSNNGDVAYDGPRTISPTNRLAPFQISNGTRRSRSASPPRLVCSRRASTSPLRAPPN